MPTFYLKLYICTLLAFFMIDMVWLAVVARGFYQKHGSVPIIVET